MAAAVIGVMVWFLPWEAWPPRAVMLLAPVAFALIAALNVVMGDYPQLFPVFFFVAFAHIGIADPRGTSLMMLPFFAAAYVLPHMGETENLALLAGSAVYVGLACVLVAEMLAWVTTKWRESQTELLHVHGTIDELGAELNSTRDPAQLWQASLEKLCRLLDVPNGHIYRLLDGNRQVCIARVAQFRPCPEYLVEQAGDSLWATDRESIWTRQPTYIASPDDPRLGEDERAEMLARGENEVLAVPLVCRDEVIGLVSLGETRKGHAMTPEKIATAVSVCRLIALSVKDAEIIQSQQQTAHRLTTLFEASRAVASTRSLEEALRIVVQRAAGALEFSECVAYEHEPDLDAIVAKAMWEKTATGWDRLGEPLPLSEYPAERAVLTSGAPLLERLSDPQLDPPSRAAMERWGEKTCLTIPMTSVEGSMGLLTFWDSERDRGLTQGDLALATALGELAGEAVRSARLLRRLQLISDTDSLTGLANHRKIHETLVREVARANRYGTHFSLAMLDIE